MLTISSKAVYGVSACFELAVRSGCECVCIEDISRAQKIPSDFLRQILPILSRSGIIKSVRGVNGGYTLAKKPAEIKIKDILYALDGSISLIRSKVSDKTLSSYWLRKEDIIDKIFDTTLDELINEKEKNKNILNFEI